MDEDPAIIDAYERRWTCSWRRNALAEKLVAERPGTRRVRSLFSDMPPKRDGRDPADRRAQPADPGRKQRPNPAPA